MAETKQKKPRIRMDESICTTERETATWMNISRACELMRGNLGVVFDGEGEDVDGSDVDDGDVGRLFHHQIHQGLQH